MSWQQRLSVQREYTGYNHRNQSNISSGNVAALVHYGRKSLRAIFVSYRRSDSQGEAGRLFDDLVSHFGEQKVFMDVAGIEAGRDFRKAIEESVANCGVLLVLIGPMWVQAKDESGVRRLDDPADFVREEVSAALRRDIAVIPVLLRDAEMPRAEELPDCLKDLAYRNCVELTHARWKSDVQLLVEPLRRLIGSSTQIKSAAESRQERAAAPPTQSSGEVGTAAKFDGPTLQRISKELAIEIGPIAEVVVKRAAASSDSTETLCLQVAEEIESPQQREMFLRKVTAALSIPIPMAAISAKDVPKTPSAPVPDARQVAESELDQPRSSRRSRSSVSVLIAIVAIALVSVAVVSFRKGSSERNDSSPAAVSSSQTAKPEESAPAASQTITPPASKGTAEEPAAAPVDASAMKEPTHRVRLPAQTSHELLSNEITPSYPPLARQAHVQGLVVLDVNISKEGAVESLKTVSGHPMLIPAAIDAVKQWRYKPYLLNNVPVSVETTVTVSFSLLNG